VSGGGVIEVALATHNQDKVREIKGIMEAGGDIRVLITDKLPEWEPVVETGTSVEENANIKALALGRVLGGVVLADDTGLEVDALGGEPGVYSSRYAGNKASYADNCRKLLREMEGVPAGRRGAVFYTTVVAVKGEEYLFTVTGSLEGTIATECRGEGGFGYDPVFFLPAWNKTLAELSLQEKNSISHRYLAFSASAQRLREFRQKGRI